MAGPINTGITGEDRDEEQDIDLNQDDPKEAVTAGLTEDQIGLNARQQTELSDPTRAENFAGAKTAQTVTDEVSATDPGYSSGHDSGVSQKEQYDTALAGASEGRHAGTYLDYLVAQRKYIEEQKKRDIAIAAIATLPDLANSIFELGQDYDEEEQEQNQTNAEAIAIQEMFDEQIAEVDQHIAEQEQVIADLEERIENGEMTQNIMVQLDSAKIRLDSMKDIREALSNEAEALIQENADRAEEFATAKAEHERLEDIAKGVQDGTITLTDAEQEQLQQDLQKSSEALQDAQDARARVDARIDFARTGHSQMTALFAGLTARNPDGSFTNDFDPDAVKARADLITTFINARADGVLSQQDIQDIKDKIDATDMTDAEKQQRFAMIQSKFAGSGLGITKADGTTVYGEEAALALVASLRGEINETNDDFTTIATAASSMVNQLADQRQGLANDVANYEIEMQYLNEMKQNGSSSIELPEGSNISIIDPNDTAMLDAQIALKQAELDNANSRLNLIDSTVDRTRVQLQETQQNYLEANQKLQDLEAQRNTTTGDALTQLNADIEATEQQLQTYKDSVQELSVRANMAQAISELTIRIEGKSQTCGIDANAELHKANVINARTAITEALNVATSDGKMTQSEFNQINTLFDQAQVSQASREAFVRAFTNSGGLLGSGELDADGKEIFLSSEETTAQLMREMAKVEAEIEQTSSQLDGVNAEIARLEAEQARIDAELVTAQAAANEEASQTVEVEADAAGAVAESLKYSSMSEYVLSNYYYGPAGNAEGTALLDAAKDPDRILTDSSGRAVFMDTETQQLYTLKMDGDEIAKDTNGVQIKEAVSHEDTVDLYNKMFENKLLPRNFVPDGDGFKVAGFTFLETEVAFEPSEHDGFLGTIGAAMTGKMDQQGLLNNIEASVNAQKAEEAVAVAERAALEGQSGAQSVDVARLQGEKADIATSLAALQQRKLNLQAQGASGNTDDTAPALRTTNEMQLGLQDVYQKVDRTSGTGIITRADLDQALGANASPELREQIEAALERDGIEIQEPDAPDNDVANNVLSNDLDDTMRDLQLAANKIMAAFPFLGIGPFQVEPIQTNTFQPDPNNIYPGGTAYQSFADNEFELTHAPGDASYKEPINNGTSSVPAAGETFSLAMTNRLNTQGQGGVSAEEALRLEREAELLMAANNPANQGGGGGMLT